MRAHNKFQLGLTASARRWEAATNTQALTIQVQQQMHKHLIIQVRGIQRQAASLENDNSYAMIIQLMMMMMMIKNNCG